jgi:cytochrome c1
VEAEEDGRRKAEERINTGIKVIAALVMVSWLMSR